MQLNRETHDKANLHMKGTKSIGKVAKVDRRRTCVKCYGVQCTYWWRTKVFDKGIGPNYYQTN